MMPILEGKAVSYIPPTPQVTKDYAVFTAVYLLSLEPGLHNNPH